MCQTGSTPPLSDTSVFSLIIYRSSMPTLRDTNTSLFKSIKHDPIEPEYIDATGQYFQGGGQTIWMQPLTKKILLVDIDTRVPTGEKQVLNPDTLDWERFDMNGGDFVSCGIFNHYLCAPIYGYDYQTYQARHIPGHEVSWVIPHVLWELTPDYQFVVAMDAEVTTSHLEVPLEWMFNRWELQKHTSMALPWDTEQIRNNTSISTDSQGRRVIKSGFVVAQNSPLTGMLETRPTAQPKHAIAIARVGRSKDHANNVHFPSTSVVTSTELLRLLSA